MRKIAIIGSGTTTLYIAHKLLQRGYAVTVYSDRTADDWLLRSAPTGTAYLYECNIMLEREIGIEHWYDTALHGQGVHLDFQPTVGADRLVLIGNFSGEGAAIDVRMRIARWMNDFEAAGGKLVQSAVTIEALNKIANAADVTLLAAGKGEIGKLIPRDPLRSVYDRPQRLVTMGIVEGFDHPCPDRSDIRAVKFNFFADAGEYFWVPYTHKDAGPTWCWLLEAKPGSYLDCMGDVRSAAEANAVMKRLIKTYAPYEWPHVEHMRPVEGDEHAWLKGAFPPTVREACARLGGGLVIPVGDTAITYDPIGGQGGNSAQRHAKFVADAIIERGDAAFDEAWANRVRDDFWEYHGRAAYAFNNILLEPLTEAGQIVLGYASQHRAFSDQHFIGNMASPNYFFPWLEDPALARAKIAEFERSVRAT
ncbi:MAG: oxidoreductase [Gammaproteobacteria bacterium]|nr:oxidoreductase [Gammaproteobacteria bacterium]